MEEASLKVEPELGRGGGRLSTRHILDMYLDFRHKQLFRIPTPGQLFSENRIGESNIPITSNPHPFQITLIDDIICSPQYYFTLFFQAKNTFPC